MSPLRRDGNRLVCQCGRAYPIVDDVPIVVQDLAGWAQSEGPSALRRSDVAPEVVELLAVDAASRRNRRLRAAYASTGGDLPGWIASTIAGAPGPVLEIGSGPGHAGTVRLDLNLDLLRAGPRPDRLVETADGVVVPVGAAVVAHAADPPFEAGAFETVVLANVLDSCDDPAVVLAQADALVAPGGRLVVTCAYAFDDTITRPAHRFDEQQLMAALTGRADFCGYGLDCRLDGPPMDLEWVLNPGPRTRHVHRVQVLTATRPR